MKKITYQGCPMTSVIVSMFGPDVVHSQLDVVSHHSTEKDVKRHELFEKKKTKMPKKVTWVPINICRRLAPM